MEHLENKPIYWLIGIIAGLVVIVITFFVVYLAFFGLVSFVTWNSSFMAMGEVHGIVRLVYVVLAIFCSIVSIIGSICAIDDWLQNNHEKLDRKSESE